MEKYLIDEINRHNEFIEDQDIAKFIIQAYTGPFHMSKDIPDETATKRTIVSEYKKAAKICREREIFQQISDNVLRLHIVPFVRKYRTADTCTGMFIKSFEHFKDNYMENIPENDVRNMLSSVGIMEIDKIISIISRYNTDRQVPHHSQAYRDHYFPAYIVILNDVIREYITLL